MLPGKPTVCSGLKPNRSNAFISVLQPKNVGM